MKKGMLLGILMVVGGSGWCEEAVPSNEKASASTASETTPVVEKKEPSITSETQAPAVTEKLAESNPTEKTVAAAPVEVKPTEQLVTESTAPVKTEKSPAVAPTEPAAAAQKPAEEKPAGRVALLNKIIDFQEKEVASVQEMIARWNATLSPLLARQQSLKEDMAKKQTQLQSLEKETTKTARKEAKTLKKEITGVEKLIQAVNKDVSVQYKSLGNELKLKAGGTEKSYQDTVRAVVEGLQSPLK